MGNAIAETRATWFLAIIFGVISGWSVVYFGVAAIAVVVASIALYLAITRTSTLMFMLGVSMLLCDWSLLKIAGFGLQLGYLVSLLLCVTATRRVLREIGVLEIGLFGITVIAFVHGYANGYLAVAMREGATIFAACLTYLIGKTVARQGTGWVRPVVAGI